MVRILKHILFWYVLTRLRRFVHLRHFWSYELPAGGYGMPGGSVMQVCGCGQVRFRGGPDVTDDPRAEFKKRRGRLRFGFFRDFA